MIRMLFISVFSLFIFNFSHAQVFNTSLGFGYDAISEGSGYPSFSVGVEGAGSSRWSVSGDFNYGTVSNDTKGGVLVDRSRYTFETNANFYFNRVLQGFFLSGGGFFGADNLTAVGAASLPTSDLNSQHAGLQFGLGFSQQVSQTLNMSLVTRLGNDFYSDDNSRLFLGFKVGYNWLAKD